MVEENGKTEVASDLELKIIRQIEYYFGDFNLGRDKFLKEEITKDSGWVSFATLLTFNRLKSLSSDAEVVVNALKKSPNNLLEINEDKTKVRRNAEKPLPANDEQRKEDVMCRSVYAKGFPETTTLDELLDYFKQNHPSVEHVQMMHKGQPRVFKGSVIVVFKTAEDAKEFVSKESIKHGESELLRETKADYKTRKSVEWAQKKEERRNKKNDDDVPIPKVQPEAERPKGCVLNVTDLPELTTREDLKSTFHPYGTVAWVDFNKGDKEAWVRFKEENRASELQAKVSSEEVKLIISEAKLTTRLLEGDEENEYWDKVEQAKAERKSMKHKGKGRFGKGGGKGKGGRGFNRGQKRGADESQSSNSKRAKSDDI
ncbi:hypothetical protein CHUAL_008918 [Chamberlinius hualienensis]